MSLPSIGFVGIGTMGRPMAMNIRQAGYPLTIFDINHKEAQDFATETGAKAVSSPGDLASCDIIVTMLPNGAIVRDVLTVMDDGAWLNKARPGAIVVDMSSSAPTGTRELGAQLAARGIILIDAPVSGAQPRALSGTLTIMIGGDDADAIERVKPLLSAMGDRLFETGGLGCGHAAKALNNYVAATAYAATAEACLIARRFGLDEHTLVDILNVSTGKSFVSEVVMKEHVVDGKYATGFAMSLLTKDVRIAEELGQSVALDAPVLRLLRQRWELANEALGDSADHSEAIKAWERDYQSDA